MKVDIMLAVNDSTIRNNFKTYCDEVTDNNETVMVTRKDDKNVVIMSLDQYNRMMKAARNEEYLAMLDKSDAELEAGKVVMKTMEELEAMEN